MPTSTSTHEINEPYRLKRLLIARLSGSFIILLLLYWFGSSTNQTVTPFYIFSLWLILSIIQIFLLRFHHFVILNLLFQIFSDLTIIGFLVYTSGGIFSPLIFLLGVVIIVAGTQAHVLLALTTAILSATTYLLAIHAHATSTGFNLFENHTLHILLQISLFFLTGGIMALIAKRHEKLQREGQKTSTQHHHLLKLHKQVLRSMQEGIIIINGDLIIKDYNDATADMIGIKPENLNQNIYSILEIPADAVAFIKLHQHSAFRCEVSHHDKKLLLTIAPLLEDDFTWLLTIVDITETRNLQQQLAKQDKLASIGQMASMLAHEIRNPMQTIAQAVELMGLTQKNDKLESIITDELSRLDRLVSDMLDYASPLYPNKQKVDIHNLISSAISQVDLNNEKGIHVTVESSEIEIDPDHFRLVIDNLLRNAVKASPDPDTILISFQQKNEGWTLQVRDHGPGINQNMRNSLFEPFQTSSKHGTGLGLATVWQVCLENHWTIDIDYTIVDGACFIVSESRTKQANEGTNG